MDKPKFYREEKRNGIEAVVIADRFAIPAWFFGVVSFVITSAMIAGVAWGFQSQQFVFIAPAASVLVLAVLYLVFRIIRWIVRQFILVNQKDLTFKQD